MIRDLVVILAGAWVAWYFSRMLYGALRTGEMDAGHKPFSGQKVVLTKAANPKLFWLNLSLAAMLLPFVCYGVWIAINGRLGS